MNEKTLYIAKLSCFILHVVEKIQTTIKFKGLIPREKRVNNKSVRFVMEFSKWKKLSFYFKIG